MRVKNERLVSVLDELYSFKEEDTKLASSEFLALANEACELLLGAEELQLEEEKDTPSNIKDSFITEIDRGRLFAHP